MVLVNANSLFLTTLRNKHFIISELENVIFTQVDESKRLGRKMGRGDPQGGPGTLNERRASPGEIGDRAYPSRHAARHPSRLARAGEHIAAQPWTEPVNPHPPKSPASRRTACRSRHPNLFAFITTMRAVSRVRPPQVFAENYPALRHNQ
jgi:hypothetical protein